MFGAGAVGGYLAVLLNRAGADVSVVARGPHLAAIQKRGLTLLADGQTLGVELPATDTPASLGKQDVVIVTLKAHSIAGAVDGIRVLLDRHTAIVSAVNGIPWWYFHGLDSPFGGTPCRERRSRRRHLARPRSRARYRLRRLSVRRSRRTGVVRHLSDNRMILGEPHGDRSERIVALASLFLAAGLKAPVRAQVRNDIWMKLWGNLAFNPLSALTHATLDVLATEPGTRAIARRMMAEGQAVGAAFGARFAVDIERRIDGAAAVGAHRTSMLQDLERGRPLEIGALVGAVQELGALAGVPTPTIDLIHALLRQRLAFP